jgi:K+-transporting ATPase ATPase B chain
VVLAKEKLRSARARCARSGAKFVPFTAQTRMSGVDVDAGEIRKGAADAVARFVEARAGASRGAERDVEDVAKRGREPRSWWPTARARWAWSTSRTS